MKKRNSKSRLPSTGKSGIWQWRTGPGVIKAVIGGTGRPIALPFLEEKTRISSNSDYPSVLYSIEGSCFLLHLAFNLQPSPKLCPRIFVSPFTHTLSVISYVANVSLSSRCWKQKFFSIELTCWVLDPCYQVLDPGYLYSSSCGPSSSSCPIQLAAWIRNLEVTLELSFCLIQSLPKSYIFHFIKLSPNCTLLSKPPGLSSSSYYFFTKLLQ